MAIITFVNRYLFFIEGFRFKPSAQLTRFLEFSSFAILTAIWAPIIFVVDYGNGTQGFEFNLEHAGLDYLVATTAAALMTVLGVRSIIVVVLSTGLFFCLRWFL